MAIDLNKIIQAAAEAALEGQGPGRQQPSEQPKRRGLTAPRALLIGAGFYTAGRLLVRARGGDLVENLQERLGDLEHRYLGGDEAGGHEDEDFEDDEYEDEPEGEYEEDEEPEAEADEDEEPEGEYEEDEEPEAEADEDEGPEGEYDEDEEPEGEYDEDEEPEGEYEEEDERPRRRTSPAGSRNGRN